MNREILFRGQTRKKGEKVRLDGSLVDGNWVYGGIFPGKERSVIYALDPVEKYTVYSETVGQFTGLTDKNGAKIFEGDIIKTHYANAHKSDFVEQVVFRSGGFKAECKLEGTGKGKMWCPLADGVKHVYQDKSMYMEWCEVIGNIFDNPELLEANT